jgi:teichuronic acid biosynthesis glycosyltransferase TuaC
MIRVLTLATLFPDAGRPTFGPFVERQTLGIAAHPDVELRVVAPLGMPPWPINQIARYRAMSRLPKRENWKGLDIYRPRFFHMPGMDGSLDPGAMVRALKPLLTDMRRDFAFDLIDAEFFFPDGPAAVALGDAFGVPVSIKARGADIHFWGSNPGSKVQVIDAGTRAAGMLAVSAAIKADMVALGMPEDRILVHYTGVDLDRFKPLDRAAAKAALGITGALIASVGALIPRKRQGLIIDALPQLPDATLVLIGKGEDQAKLAARATELGVADRIRFTGAIGQDEIARWLGAADVMALPSASEGLANAWVEALACGTPIVLCDVGGARELVDRAEAGRLVEPTSDAVGEAIADLLANPPTQDGVRATAEQFTWERNTAALYSHFARLVTSFSYSGSRPK